MRLVFIILSLFLLSCEKPTNKFLEADGYVVGFDPCSLKGQTAQGYVIITTNLKDTLMTYNLPENLENFPVEYFQNYLYSGYFPSSARYEFKVRITYSIATESEKKYPLCFSSINQSEFYRAIQIVIKTASKY